MRFPRRGTGLAVLLALALEVGSGGGVGAQTVAELRFVNQEIIDILLALAELSDLSIVPDETVTGRASYHFSDIDIDTALEQFLSAYRLTSRREGRTVFVSRVGVDFDPQRGTVSLSAEEVPIKTLYDRLARAAGVTVFTDPLPDIAPSVHLFDVAPAEALAVLTARLADFALAEEDGYFYVRNTPEDVDAALADERPIIAAEGDGYRVVRDRVRFHELIDALFTEAERRYSSLVRRDVTVENLRVGVQPFEALLRYVLEQAQADYRLVGDVYYLFDISERDVLKKLKSTVRIALSHQPAEDVVNMLPVDFATANLYRVDRAANAIILTGSLEQIGPVEAFIRSLDRPVPGRRYRRFDLSYLDVADVTGLLPAELRYLEPRPIPDTDSFVVAATEQAAETLATYLASVDTPPYVEHLRLRYLTAAELLANLPPSVQADEVLPTADPSSLFIRAPAARLRDLSRELALVDRPRPQIRYDLLVVQYQEGDSLAVADELSAASTNAAESFAMAASLGKLLSLSFDVVAAFGYQFAVQLSADMSTTAARVLADTTLNALSGEEVRFQNTDTFRYRDVEVDPDTGESAPTGVVREITSGLIVEIEGWVSGDGMITMQVDATVSKRGADVSSETGDPPPTSERVVSTQVRARSGEHVVISGLYQQERTETVQKVPLLGDIPVIGALFRSTDLTDTTTELVLYLVPHVSLPDGGGGDVAEVERLYRKYFDGLAGVAGLESAPEAEVVPAADVTPLDVVPGTTGAPS